MTPLLMLEINEVPWRLIERYRHFPDFSNINRFFAEAVCYSTMAVDSGELSPWVTWPTLHRGMNNENHGIRNLGQDPLTFAGSPIWRDFLDRGESVGVLGAMQSWPPEYPGESGFFIPDTFAADGSCYPSSLRPLQEFNLRQVRRNPRILSKRVLDMQETLPVLSAALKAGISLNTFARIAAQLALEKFRPGLVARRPCFQAILFWDVFVGLYRPSSPPAYASFFTNHVAGLMHRYWRDVFPEDFVGKEVFSSGAKSQEPAMRFALEILDRMLAQVFRWRSENPSLVVCFASSMGQGPVYRSHHPGKEIIVVEPHRFMQASGLRPNEYELLLAMVPHVAVKVEDPQIRQRAIDSITGYRTDSGLPFVEVDPSGSTLSITVHNVSRQDAMAGGFMFDVDRLSWEDAGIRATDIDPGTGYHIPEGTLAFLGGSRPPKANDCRQHSVAADRVKSWLLRIAERGFDEVLLPPVPNA